jgi:hypothetical protein
MVKKELLCEKYLHIRKLLFPVIKHNTIIFDIGIAAKAKRIKYFRPNGFYFIDLLNIYAKQYVHCIYDDDIEANSDIVYNENEIQWNLDAVNEKLKKNKYMSEFWNLEGFEYDTITHYIEPLMEQSEY